jgi:hypothetical protein
MKIISIAVKAQVRQIDAKTTVETPVTGPM